MSSSMKEAPSPARISILRSLSSPEMNEADRRNFDVLEKVRNWTLNGYALKLEILRQGMSWEKLSEFLVREELSKRL